MSRQSNIRTDPKELPFKADTPFGKEEKEPKTPPKKTIEDNLTTLERLTGTNWTPEKAVAELLSREQRRNLLMHIESSESGYDARRHIAKIADDLSERMLQMENNFSQLNWDLTELNKTIRKKGIATVLRAVKNPATDRRERRDFLDDINASIENNTKMSLAVLRKEIDETIAEEVKEISEKQSGDIAHIWTELDKIRASNKVEPNLDKIKEDISHLWTNLDKIKEAMSRPLLKGAD